MAGMEAVVNLLVRAVKNLIPSAECIPSWSAFDESDESFSSCKRDVFSGMRAPEAICIGTRKEVSPHSESSREQEGENKLQLSKTQLKEMEGVESVPDWSGLLTELLGEIAIKLTIFEDFTAFRGVCTSWRAAATRAKFVPVPLLMLAEKDGDGDVREFYSLCKSKVSVRMRVPEAMGKRCTSVGFGWILTVARSGGELNLVKPLSSAKIKLPNMMTFPGYRHHAIGTTEIFYTNQAVLSANPTETSDFLLMVVLNLDLGFWRNGDNQWTKIEANFSIWIQCTPRFADIGYYKHKWYGVDFKWNLWRWDPCLLTKEAEILLQLDVWTFFMDRVSLVESSKGELLLITRNSLYRSEEWMPYEPCFGIFQIDTVQRRCRKMNSLDGDAIFIGQNRGVSIAANDFPGLVKADCIYFTDTDWKEYIHTADGGGADMGIYSVEDKSVERFDVESFSLISPPLWVCPSL